MGPAKFKAINFKMNNSTDNSPASEANGRPASQRTRYILCNKKVLCDLSMHCRSPGPNTPGLQPTTALP
jgi:hypothetical protein